MKQLIAATVLLSVSTIGVASDRNFGERKLQHRFTEYADVIDVQPVFREVSYQKPQRECWIEQEQYVTHDRQQHTYQEGNYRYSDRRSSGGDTLIGGIIGGVIGNQIGRNGSRSTRNGATVAGAIIGSAIANNSRGDTVRHRRHRNERRHSQPQPVYNTRDVEKCRTTTHTSYEKKIQAYDVTYQYRGNTFTTRMKRDPGRRIELQVNVKPARH